MKKSKKIWGAGLVSAALASVIVAGSFFPLAQSVSATDIILWSDTTLSSDKPVISETGTHDINFTLSAFTKDELRLLVQSKTASFKIPEELVGKIEANGDAQIEITYELAKALFEELGINNLVSTIDNGVDKLAAFLAESELFGYNVNFDDIYAALDLKTIWDNISVLSLNAPVTVSEDGAYLSVTFEDNAFDKIAEVLRDIINNIGTALDTFEITNPGVMGGIISSIAMSMWDVVVDAYDLLAAPILHSLVDGADLIASIGDFRTKFTTKVILPTTLTAEYDFFKTYAPHGLTVEVDGTFTTPALIPIELWTDRHDTTTITFADIVAPDAPVVNAINGTQAAGYTINADDIEKGATITVVNANGDVLASGIAGPVDLVVAAGAAKAEETLYLYATDTAGNKSDSAIAVMPVEAATADEAGTNGTNGNTPNTSGLPVTGDDAAVFGLLGGLGAVTAAAYFLIRKKS
ncbi:adhesive domain-containing protein [Culicoidibacter larvae]|uniref:LPXTG cell wall anchor domain-containing protein n=1 Tax=Culicoidibacter larvae TaxID=2579976 RepID=A0A5R8QDZ6_9FIRM|nr:adhesive domain-containing protein [Culicoidibacter larvae]TLG75424.1 LPXTG cell wall anchor domain-containing protein [Culicoidibacter larvae]